MRESVRERENEKEKLRESERKKERETDRQTDRQTDISREKKEKVVNIQFPFSPSNIQNFTFPYARSVGL